MRHIREDLSLEPAPEHGFTLVEVLVAMFIFMIIATSALYTMVSLFSVTRDSRARQVASNLAAQEIDLSRDAPNLFDLDNVNDRIVALNGDTFHVTRTTNWVSNDATAGGCGSGTLRFKRVQVVVTWDNMRRGSTGVQTDTVINPRERINDPDRGTILVTVNNASGEPVEDVPVTAWLTGSPGTTLTATTDDKGCAYLLMVNPGDYTVSLGSPTADPYVDLAGDPAPQLPAHVTKSTTTGVDFSYDRAGLLASTYGDSSLRVPIDFHTTLLSTRDPAVIKASGSANPRNIPVYPWPDGYSVVAGNTSFCAAADPDNWNASGSRADGGRPDPIAVEAGQTLATTVGVGVVQVSNINGSRRYITAVSQDTTAYSGQPNCATEIEYRFAQIPNGTGTVLLALPYGSWQLYWSNSYSTSGGNRINDNNLAVIGQGDVNNSSETVTFDPRPPS